MALDLITDLTGAGVTEAGGKTWFTNMRAALAGIGDPLGRFGAIQNFSFVPTVNAGALTLTAKTRAGATPSASDPISIAFRNATLDTGDFSVGNVTAALSVVVSSGSTLGHANATASPVYVYGLINGSTVELAVSTKYFGSQVIVSTIAEGGVGAADSATVMYSTTARTNVPAVLLGRWTSTQTTAGTWAATTGEKKLAPFTPSNDDISSIYINDSSNANMALGLTINQGAADDEILSLKSSDVAHGITTQTETDTFGAFKKASAAQGGVLFNGYSGTVFGLVFSGTCTTEDATKSNSANAPIQISGKAKTGTTDTTLGVNSNIMTVQNFNTVRFIMDADGDSHQDVGTAWTNFDAFDDVALLDALSVAVSKPDDPIRASFGEFLKYNRDALEKAKLVTFNEDGHHFVNMSKLTMALTGAVRQIGHACKAAQDRLATIEARMLALEAAARPSAIVG